MQENTMKLATALLAAGLTAFFASNAAAQQGRNEMASAVKLPKECASAAQAGGHMQEMQSMMDQMQSQMGNMTGTMDGQMGETQKGLHEAMMKMHGPMMEGAMAKDADVSWICAMIPHHQGAIDMARAGLKGSDNAESRRMAEETIQMQEKEIEKLTAWVEKHAEREMKNETTGSIR
jgi:uncharacterized protein (DUF305 family)